LSNSHRSGRNYHQRGEVVKSRCSKRTQPLMLPQYLLYFHSVLWCCEMRTRVVCVTDKEDLEVRIRLIKRVLHSHVTEVGIITVEVLPQQSSPSHLFRKCNNPSYLADNKSTTFTSMPAGIPQNFKCILCSARFCNMPSTNSHLENRN